MISATRFHDFSAGHRVVGHEGKCIHFHGHNYRAHFTVVATGTTPLDDCGRVLDFSVINTHLCHWLEDNWDHKMILWEDDPFSKMLDRWDSFGVCIVPFNPTAENMAKHLVEVVGPAQLRLTRCELVTVTMEETRKCSATYTKGDAHDLRNLVY